MDKPTILQLLAVYRTFIVHTLLEILEGRLVYYEYIPTVTKHIYCINFHVPLRHSIFNLVHGSPVYGYMAEYKILYRIKIGFFWPRLRSDVSDRIK